MSDELREYRRKRDSGEDPGAVLRRRSRERAADLRRPAARRPEPALRLPPRAERGARARGRCRRACRSSRASAPSPCTSRTIRSTTPASRARFRRASTAPARSRSGTPARTSSSRRSRTAVSPSACTASGSTARGRSFRRRSTGRRRTGSSSASATTAHRRRVRNDYRPMLATLAEQLPTGDEWLFEVKWDGYRALGVRPRRRREARQPQRQRPHRALPRRRARARTGRAHPRLRRRRRGVRARRAGPPELLGDAAGQAPARRSSTRCSTSSRSTASRFSTCRSTERRGAPRAAARSAREDGAALGGVRRRRGAPRRRDGAGARGRDGEARRLPLPRGQAHARLAEDQDARPSRSSSSAATRKGRGGARAASARSCSGTYRDGELAGSATAGRASPSATIDELLAQLEPLAARRLAVRRRAEDAEASARADVVVGRAEARRARSKFAEWTHDGHLRAPVVPGAPRRQAGAEAVVREDAGRA